MNKENLLKLADFIENNVRDDQFHDSVIMTCEDESLIDDDNYLSLLENDNAMFCALGLVPIVFPEFGIKYEQADDCQYEYYLVKDNDIDFGVAAELFEISCIDAGRLFNGVDQRNRMDLVNDIRAYMETGVLP